MAPQVGGRSGWAGVLVLLAAGVLCSAGGCGRSGGPQSGEYIVPVVGFRSAVEPVEERIPLTGTLEADEWVELKSETAGTVEGIFFEEGERVRRGRLLLRMDRDKLQAEMAEAEANRALAESERRRYRDLLRTHAVSRQEAERAEASFKAAQAAVALLEARLEDSEITAPFDGVTGARRVSPGQFVPAGTVLTTLVSPDPMKAEFHVPERYLSRIRKGQPVTLRVAAYPEDRFTGTVYFIDPQVQETTRTALVKAKVPNPAGKLRHGMFAALELTVAVRKEAVVIPEQALRVELDRASVFVVDENGTARLRPVETGLRLPGRVEIRSGLRPGEVVVAEGTQKLRPGAKVKLRFEGEPERPER